MKVCKISGIKIGVHWSALILFGLLFSNLNTALMQRFTDINSIFIIASSALISITFMLSILAHEFGHIFAGRAYGLKFKSVTLHMLGGVAQWEGNLPSAKSEIIMSLAGPAVSMAIAAMSFAVMMLSIYFLGFELLTISLSIVVSGNAMLGIFNLIPAFPLDGGRVLRSILWSRSGNFVKATESATKVGRGFAISLFSLGILMCFGVEIPLLGTGVGSGIWIMFISVLVWIMAAMEYKNTVLANKQIDKFIKEIKTAIATGSISMAEVKRLEEKIGRKIFGK